METRRILILDSHDDWREWLAARLRDSGIEVLESSTPKEAYEILCAQEVHALLFDPQTPQMNGMRFLKAMRWKGVDLPAVVLSAVVGEQQKLEAARLGVLGCFEKPVKLSSLLKTVQQALDLGAQMSQIRTQIRSLDQAQTESAKERQALLRSQLVLLRLKQQESSTQTLGEAQTP